MSLRLKYSRWFIATRFKIQFPDIGAPTEIIDTFTINGKTGSFSDDSGNLLFVQASGKIYDKLLRELDTIEASIGFYHGAVFLEKPGNPNIIYCFTTKGSGASGTLYYHIIDMGQNSSYGIPGKIISKNNVIAANVNDTLHVTAHGNGSSYWVVVHQYNTNKFLAFEVSSTAINVTPVESAIGSADTNPGPIKVSPNGARLSYINWTTNRFLLYAFDKSTGIVSGEVFNIDTNTLFDTTKFSGSATDMEFSPNSNRLYLAVMDKLYQYDLNSGNIPGSKVNIATAVQETPIVSGSLFLGAMALAIDGKIYMRNPYKNATDTPLIGFSCINFPDQLGIAGSGFLHNALPLNGGTPLGFQIPNYPSSINFTPPPAPPSPTPVIEPEDECGLKPSIINYVVQKAYCKVYDKFAKLAQLEITGSKDFLAKKVEAELLLFRVQALENYVIEPGGVTCFTCQKITELINKLNKNLKLSIDIEKLIEEGVKGSFNDSFNDSFN